MLGSCVGWGCTICSVHPSPSVWVCPGSWYHWRVEWKDFTNWWRLEMAFEPPTYKILVPGKKLTNYWIRLSRMWRIMQSEEDVWPRWITSSETCIILHIIRKLISIIIVLLFIQSISKFLTILPSCILSFKLCPISLHGFRIKTDVFHTDNPKKADNILWPIVCVLHVLAFLPFSQLEPQLFRLFYHPYTRSNILMSESLDIGGMQITR